MEKLLLISGSVGVGKTTIGNELSTLLEADEVRHTYMDLDALAYTFPRSSSDPFGDELAIENLIAVWANCRKRGSENLIIPRVIDSKAYAQKISDAVGIPNPVICRLTASDQTLLQRVRTREIGSNLSWHENRTIDLSAELDKSAIEDFTIETDARSITDIATDIMQRISWCRS